LLLVEDNATAALAVGLSVGGGATVFGNASPIAGSAGSVLVKNGGVLQVNAISTGTSGLGTVTVANATVQFTANAPTIDLKTAGTFSLASGTVAFLGATDAAIKGQITNITFSGDNRLRLALATNAPVDSYTFQTNNGQNFAFLDLQNGTFQATNLTIGSGGLLTGSGTVNGMNVTNAGTISPGSSPGTLTFSSNLTLTADSILNIGFTGTNAGGFDTIVVSGALTLGGKLNVDTNGMTDPFTAGQVFTIASGALSTNGVFADTSAVPDILQVGYTADGFNLTVIPEPASIGLMMALGGLLLLRRRLRA